MLSLASQLLQGVGFCCQIFAKACAKSARRSSTFRRMFGHERMDAVIGSVQGDVRFYGLTPTSMKLEGLDRHLRLIDSYKKLHAARANITSA
ncbi:hypothetical protein V6L78_17765 [Pseudomonas canadensis]|uniref:hypothetical protein n=1 Tax=Pseudomonas canadensis TaxID=915099 RepID=UPI0030CF6469